jgi:hypothetical protein
MSVSGAIKRLPTLVRVLSALHQERSPEPAEGNLVDKSRDLRSRTPRVWLCDEAEASAGPTAGYTPTPRVGRSTIGTELSLANWLYVVPNQVVRHVT